MSKRRSTEGSMFDMLPSKRVAIDACTTACGSGSAYTSGSQAFQADASVGQPSSSALVHDCTLEVWLAVAAQVQGALAALPGWIQVAQAAHYDQPEHLSSISSASTPLPVQQHGGIDCGSWPVQPSASDFAEGAGAQATGSTPGAPAAVGTPVAVAAPSAAAAAADQPAQPAPAAVAAAAAIAPPDSCTSESDAAAAACGWFSKCRGCCQLTAGEVELQGQVVPLCRGCSCALHRRPPAQREHVVHRIMRTHAVLSQREAAGAGCSS